MSVGQSNVDTLGVEKHLFYFGHKRHALHCCISPCMPKGNNLQWFSTACGKPTAASEICNEWENINLWTMPLCIVIVDSIRILPEGRPLNPCDRILKTFKSKRDATYWLHEIYLLCLHFALISLCGISDNNTDNLLIVRLKYLASYAEPGNAQANLIQKCTAYRMAIGWLQAMFSCGRVKLHKSLIYKSTSNTFAYRSAKIMYNLVISQAFLDWRK